MATGAVEDLPPGFDGYYDSRLDIGFLTVERLKQALRFMNSRCRLSLRLSGNKADLVERIRMQYEEAFSRVDAPLYTSLRQCVIDASTLQPPFNLAPSIQPPAIPQSAPQPAAAPLAARTYPPPVAPQPGPSRQPHANGYAASAAKPALPASPRAAPAAPASALPITFRSSPFYRVETSAMSVVTMPVAQAGDRKTVSAQIGLSPDQRQKLLDAKASPSNPQYQLRMFCCTDQYYTPQSTYGYNRGQHVPASQPRGPAPVDFPAACEVKVNAINIGSHKIRGVKKKEGSIMPPDITPQAHLPVGTVNRIEIVYINTEKRYFGLVYLVEAFSISQLVERLKKGKYRSKEDVVNYIRKSADDDEIQATSTELTLKDPLTFTRIKTPIRSIHCSHIQCFDGEMFLTMMEQTPTWECPVCNKTLKYEELAVDGYLEDILKNTSSSTESVIVDEQGGWAPPVAKAKTRSESPSKSRRPSHALDDDDDGDSDEDLVMTRAASRPKTIAPVINLDGTSPAASPATNGGGRSAVVIDLTASDDEGPPPAPARQAGSFQTWAGSNANGHAGGPKRTASDSFGDEGDARGAPRPRQDVGFR